MRRLTIGKKVALTCTTLVVLAVVITAVAVGSGSKVLASVQGTSKAIPVLQRLATLQSLGLEFRGTNLLMGTPGLSGDYKQKQLAHLSDLKREIAKSLQEYELVAPAAERSLLEKTKEETASFVDTCEQFRQLALSGQEAKAGAFWSNSGGARSKAFRQAIQDEVDFNNTKATEFVNNGLVAGALGRNLCSALAAVSVIAGAILTWLLVGNINSVLGKSAADIQEIATQVSDASSQVASSSRQVASASSEQAASLEETSASGYEVKSLTARNTEHSHAAFELMGKVEGSVSESNRQLGQMIESMNDITRSSQEITKITKVIEDIAFQTNILALNAAVEAARAGESGLGFAVVADEVRNLASRCSSAARNTSELIEQSVHHAKAGSSRLGDVTSSMEEISRNATEASRLMNELNVSAIEQSRGMEQISKALIQMEQVTQQTAANAQESATASQQLEAQSQSMQNVVLHLHSLILS